MAAKDPETALDPEEEIRRLRDKTDKGELEELRHGMLGGYNNRDVATFVGRLKYQLQTSERTYKSRIAELSAEKEQLRIEREALESQLAQRQTTHDGALDAELKQARQAAEAFLADRAALEEKYKHAARPDEEMIAGMKSRMEALEAELAQAQKRSEELAEAQKRNEELRSEHKSVPAQGKDDFRADMADFQAEKAAFQAEKAAMQAEKESLKAQIKAFDGKSDVETAGLRSDMEEWKSLAAAERAVSARYLEKLEESGRHMECLSKENAALSAQMEDAKQKIAAFQLDKDAMEGINEQMRKAMNSLVAKAESVMKENNVMNTLLESEREKVQQYRAANDKLTETLARMRVNNQMLEESSNDLDKIAVRDILKDIPQMKQSPLPAPKSVKPEAPEYADAKSNPMQDIINEFNAIQANLARYQQTKRTDEYDKKSSVRYSEKRETDNPKGRADDTREVVEEFRMPGVIDFSRKN